VQLQMGSKAFLGGKYPPYTFFVGTDWRVCRTDMILARSPGRDRMLIGCTCTSRIHTRISLFFKRGEIDDRRRIRSHTFVHFEMERSFLVCAEGLGAVPMAALVMA